MTSSEPPDKSDQATLRDLLKLDPEECLWRIAEELKTRLNCETACILRWHEVWRKDDRKENRVLVTDYHNGMPGGLDNPEIYHYGEGITGGYIFEQENSIRGRVDLKGKKTYDDEALGEPVKVKGIKWHNMRKFGANSVKHDFKSLLGLPLFVKNQKIGVIKLINKIDLESNQLAEAGFSQEDLDRVTTFLSTIEMVIESKRNEEQIKNLLKISERIISADFDYDELLQNIVLSCVDALNISIGIIRLLERKELRIKANSLGLGQNKGLDKLEISRRVVEEKTSIKWDEKNGFETIGEPAKRYRIKPPKAFKDLGIKTFLAIPVIYQANVIGVLECYTFLPHDFSGQELDVIKAYGSTLISILFQRNRIKHGISSLTESFSLLPTPKAVYERVRKLIEGYLDTETVSVWENRATEVGFEFELVDAGQRFWKEYERDKIRTLSELSLTARIAGENKIHHLPQQELERYDVEHSTFIKRNNLKSMTIVPITIGQQANAVVDVFYDHERSLLNEERDFLSLLAGKAATAIWIKKITRSFKPISDALLDEPEVGATLQKIAETAREELYAEPVILLQYDPARQEFMLPPIFSRGLRERKGMYSGANEKHPSDFVSLMLQQHKPLYLEGEQKYKEFCQSQGTVRPWHENDFWHREGICSMAAIRLEDSRKRPIGVMFINYRSLLEFDSLTMKMIELFASQAASAIANARFKIMWNYGLLSSSTERMIVDLMVDHADTLDSATGALANLEAQLESATESIPKKDVQKFVEQLRDPLKDFGKLYRKLRDYREQFYSRSRYGDQDINNLIEDLLAVLESRIQSSGIVLRQPKYGKNLPTFFSDDTQIKGTLYQLISILFDAATANVTLGIETHFHKSTRTIIITMYLLGTRLSDEEVESILAQPVRNPYNQKARVLSRFDFCQELARLHSGDVDIKLSPGKVFSELSLQLRD
jgi:GAF domain-containing protein